MTLFPACHPDLGICFFSKTEYILQWRNWNYFDGGLNKLWRGSIRYRLGEGVLKHSLSCRPVFEKMSNFIEVDDFITQQIGVVPESSRVLFLGGPWHPASYASGIYYMFVSLVWDKNISYFRSHEEREVSISTSAEKHECTGLATMLAQRLNVSHMEAEAYCFHYTFCCSLSENILSLTPISNS